MTKNELKKLIKEVISELKEDLSPEALRQVKLEINKYKKLKDPIALYYYEEMLKNNYSAFVSYERFKGSWEYDQWLKKESTIKGIQDVNKELKRLSFLHESMKDISYEEFKSTLLKSGWKIRESKTPQCTFIEFSKEKDGETIDVTVLNKNGRYSINGGFWGETSLHLDSYCSFSDFLKHYND